VTSCRDPVTSEFGPRATTHAQRPPAAKKRDRAERTLLLRGETESGKIANSLRLRVLDRIAAGKGRKPRPTLTSGL